jgi:transcriptional regulator with XRE-family HTH domain
MSKANSQREEISSRLRLAREMAGLSQAQVAKMLSLHRPSISEIEAGRRKVSAEELAKLAEIYDIKLSWLAGSDTGDSDEVDERVKLAAREIAKLKPTDYKRLLELLKMLHTER